MKTIENAGTESTYFKRIIIILFIMIAVACIYCQRTIYKRKN